VPALLRSLTDENSNVGILAAKALARIAPEALTNAPPK